MNLVFSNLNQELWSIARQQSAWDLNCAPEDFLKKENVIVRSCKNERARKYLELPHTCDLVSYGSNIVASVTDGFAEMTEQYMRRYSVHGCFETPNLHILNDELQKHGQRICFMAEYFLPDIDVIPDLVCPYETRLMFPADFKELYVPEWGNALCEKRKELDVLGVGAYDGKRLIALAACSADCEDMWQIGIDVLPEYRRQGLAATLTSRLAREILARGKVPFYCAAWSNIASVRNAIGSGFRPAWVEVTAKSAEFINKMNAGGDK